MTDEKILGTEKISKLMLRLALPSIAAQLINVLYSIVDRIYIGRMEGIGDLALTGIGITTPILLIISAFSSFIGAGGAPLSAIALGKGDRDRAEKILGSGMTALLTFSAVLTVCFLFFKRPLLYAFGASDNTISYADDYITIYLIGTVFVQLALGLNPFISSQGQAKTAMLSVLIGAAANIILDPIFIFVFRMGVRGAALATVLSQALSALWVVRFLVSKRSAIRLRFRSMKPDFLILASVAALGVSPFIMGATESAISIVLNSQLKRFGGDLYVGALTIMQSVLHFLFVPVQGFNNGVQPIISYNFGAGKFDRVKKTFRIMFFLSLFVMIVGYSLICLFPHVLAQLFSTETDLVDLAAKMMPLYFAGMSIFGIQCACQTTFVGLGQAKISLFIALLRKVILMIPLALILPNFFGVMGVYYAEPVSDVISALSAGTLFLFTYKKILSQDTLSRL